ncbi:MucR family transcriptional regulator [Mesorhizobium sp. CGMCC 1.15528]|uniref:MucR family transcriptional regulator n=1 Tax=Mesorhizobium zhangyense TaxID=1776730 RepID=A0A7C9V9Z1_9HYPH|nr:MucR family transcriptional regulator [Mesorhizobium zhangyense]NGN43523.1 MucR family transcriptional regulator [Mesorhizobium zhangyense]
MSEIEDQTEPNLRLTAHIVSAYVSNNPVPRGELAGLIGRVNASIQQVSKSGIGTRSETLIPAVPIRKSVTPDFIISLEDGKKFKSLKRHLNTHYGMTPDDYRAKWGLPADYPMVAPNYTAARSQMAKKMGLGRKSKLAKAPSSTSKNAR